MIARLRALCCLAVTFAAAPAVAALPDPTRPPSASQAGVTDVGNGLVLQSILISGRRHEATISGRTVKVGDRVGDAKVLRISETEVHLGRGRSVERLTLFPDVQKKVAPAKMPAKASGSNQ